MTKQADFKRRVRARTAKTGESYDRTQQIRRTAVFLADLGGGTW